MSVYDDCLASSDPAADDAFYAEADSARAQGNCPDNAAGLPRIVTKDEGNLALEVDSNKDVYITRLRREAVSVVDLDKRVGEVELVLLRRRTPMLHSLPLRLALPRTRLQRRLQPILAPSMKVIITYILYLHEKTSKSSLDPQKPLHFRRTCLQGAVDCVTGCTMCM